MASESSEVRPLSQTGTDFADTAPLKRHHSMICTARAVRAWSGSPVTRCRLQYPAGIIAEHLHTRAEAGLFDVSHMGQIRLRGTRAVSALEALVPESFRRSRRSACATRCC